ncbi:MAG TPA: PEP-CTERM sorting domain-containing protein [Verrucomicrobiae bacterium]
MKLVIFSNVPKRVDCSDDCPLTAIVPVIQFSMKKILITAVLFASLSAMTPSILDAQGIVYVSNLGDTPTGSAAVGSDSWIAQTFITGTNVDGYSLSSVELLLNTPSGNPSGFSISVYSISGNSQTPTFPGAVPQVSIGSFSGPDPTTAGIFDYTTPGIALSASTWYVVLVTATTPINQGAYIWSAANSITTGSFDIENSYFSSHDGSSWTWVPRQNIFQMAIYASPIPEPETGAMLVLGMAAFGIWRLRRIQ